MQLILHVIGHESGMRDLRLPVGQYVLGRSRTCQVRFKDKRVSRRHAVLKVGPDSASVHDLGSRNGTLVNDRWTTGELLLHDGDRFSIATIRCRVRLLTDEEDAGPACVTVPREGQGQSIEIPVLAAEQPVGVASSSSDFAARTQEMWTRFYIYGPRFWVTSSTFELEDALNGFLQGHGEASTEEDQGLDWGIDLMLYPGEDIDTWVGRLVKFLQDWPVPKGSAISITAYPAAGGYRHQRVEIPAK